MIYKALWDITNQFNSKNGNILASGKIYIYYQGRTSLADTYKDEDGTVLNTNPVLLDNNGMATVFVRPIYAYTIVVCDYYGVELFSRDITIRDAISTAEDVVVIGSDGTVQIDTTQLPNGVQYDCSVNTDIIATKESVDNNKADIIDLTTVVNNHTTELDEINTDLLSKKDKQSPYSASGSPTNTITDISQDENGEISVTYSDIKLPAEVPNVEITSDNNSITVTESTDIETNTKTFDLQVNANDTESEYGQFISTNVVTSAQLLKVKGNLELSSGNIKLKKGNSYHFTLHGEYVANQANTCSNINFIEYSSSKVIEVNVDNTISEGQNFELSYDVYDFNVDTDYYVTFSNVNGVITELTIYVHSIGGVAAGGGGGTSYTDGNGINITNDEISVDAGDGLGFDYDGKLEIKVGTGLEIDDNKLIVIDNDVSDVVTAVNKLKEDLDQKITTTYPFAQITQQGDYAGFGVTNTSRMIGQLFAIPISSEIRKDETVLYVNALQNYSGDVSFGIFEYDFDGNDGSGSTYWIADTGKVKIQAGENRFALLNVKNDIQELQSSKLYYAVIAIKGDAPSSGLYLASSPNYSTTYNANPKYTLLVSNMDQYIDWNTGSLPGAWFKGYNEDNNIPRLFMMLRNGSDEATPPIPITEPFVDIGTFTLEHQYKISSIFSLTPTTTGAVYRKVIPLKDVDITSFRYVDYRGSVGQEPQRSVLLDDTYTPTKYISDGSWTLGNSDQTTIDGAHFVHEFTFNTPVHLTAGNVYWFMTGGNLGNLGDSWMITYSSPSVSNDLLLVEDMYNVNSFIITNGFGEYIGGAPGMYLQLKDNNNNEWTI